MSIIDDLQPSTTHFNPVSGKPYPLQVANPHTNVDVIHSAVDSSAGDAGISTLLYDFVLSDGSQQTIEHVDDQTMQSFYSYGTVPHPSGQGVTFPVKTVPLDPQYVYVPIPNLNVGDTVYVSVSFYDTPQPLSYLLMEDSENITPEFGQPITFVATSTTHTLALSAEDVHDGFSIHSVSVTTSSEDQGTCAPFLRTFKDGVTTDIDLDGQPYTVVGEVRTSCTAAQAEPTCTCTDELQALQVAVDEINGKIQTPTNTPINTQYYHKTGAYRVYPDYKHVSVTFVNEGTINNQYAPAGYSFTHDYMEQGYTRMINLDGTSYLVWETR